jgi:hypothetical protein
MERYADVVVHALTEAEYPSHQWDLILQSFTEEEMAQFTAAAEQDVHAHATTPSVLVSAGRRLRRVTTEDKSAPRTDMGFVEQYPLRKRLGESVAEWRERELFEALPKGCYGFNALETADASIDFLLARAKERHPQLQEDHSYQALEKAAEQQHRRSRPEGTPLVLPGGLLSPRAKHTPARVHTPSDDRWTEGRSSHSGLRISFDHGEASADNRYRGCGSPRSQALLRRANGLRDQQSLRVPNSQAPIGSPERGTPTSRQRHTPRTPSSPMLSRALELSGQKGSRSRSSSQSRRASARRPIQQRYVAARSDVEVSRALARTRPNVHWPSKRR